MKIECLNHVKTLKLKHRLQIPKWQAVGILETLFNFAAVNADDGNIGRYTNDEICLYLEYFDSSDKLIEALIESGFVDVCDENRLSIHDWNEHAPKYIKDRIAKRNKRRSVSQTVVDKTPDVDAGSKMSGKIAINQAQPNQAKPNQSKRNEFLFLVLTNYSTNGIRLAACERSASSQINASVRCSHSMTVGSLTQ